MARRKYPARYGVTATAKSLAAAIAIGLPLIAMAQTPQAPSSASAMKEMHGDWSVTCADRVQGSQSVKACVVSQTQIDPRTHQRVLTLEMAPGITSANATAATVLLPFGLVLDQGVAFQIDNNPVGAPARFQTCLPVGCVVQMRFDTKTVAMLRQGTAIKLVAVAANDGKKMLFTVPLKGLGEAVDRSLVLTKS